MLRPVFPFPFTTPISPRLLRARALAASLLLAAAAVALTSAGCGPSAPQPSTAADDVAAPYPFTVFDIRAGCPLGRVIEYRIETAGEPTRIERWAFTPIDLDSVNVTTTTFDAEGKAVGAPTTESAKWAELHEHARFPRAQTTISNESISLPAGTFDAMKYVVTKGDEVKTVWFARSLPGPPVKLEVTKGGQAVMTWTMQANQDALRGGRKRKARLSERRASLRGRGGDPRERAPAL